MIKKGILCILLVFSTWALWAQEQNGQGKFSSALGLGSKQNYNNMMLPYEFKGYNFSLNLEWQIFSNDWLSDTKVCIYYAPLFAFNSATNIAVFNTSQECLGAEMQYQVMKKVLTLFDDRFSLFAGGNVAMFIGYEYFIDVELGRNFFTLDFSLGASLYAEYKLDKATISNNFSMPIVAGSFYPHYGNYLPFFSVGGTSHYFIVSPIGKLNRINNYLKVKVPVFVKGKLLNTFFLGYHFGYEYSTIRDNPIRDIGHIVLVGIVFKITK